uniref:Integrin alpha N-terminal domain-containing protein n=1 Tax=Attheya septentrionalis TaxID=420275 RepID=A0A7S2UK60_9STRA|mmetsp:Transcript_28928/g.52949  ORF Transcript_28928/g.52949 Transcript_28928/m.52949 type:complete len:556 (+) Transcript_28928:239-1906(+)
MMNLISFSVRNHQWVTAIIFALYHVALVGAESESLYQPADVIELQINKRNAGSMMKSEGTPWCQGGAPAYWWTGHSQPDKPMCEVKPNEWEESTVAILDLQDEKNKPSGPGNIDRHGCVAIDLNGDLKEDMVCMVGADGGDGVGFNEVYLTQEDGTLSKIFNHGLDEYPTLRAREIYPLRSFSDGSLLLFITTNGIPRDDGKPNEHRMYKQEPLQGQAPSQVSFKEVAKVNGQKAPWILDVMISSVIVADFDDNGTDDFIMFDRCTNCYPIMFLQTKTGGWKKKVLSHNNLLKSVGAARLADVTGDGVSDLIVVGEKENQKRVVVFEGTKGGKFFETVVFTHALQYATPDLEVFDMNGDGYPDIYVVQVDEFNVNSYCGMHFNQVKKKFYSGRDRPQNPESYKAPQKAAADILLVGTADPSNYRAVEMNFFSRGCGFMVRKFGGNRLALGQGTFSRVGSSLLLQWPIVSDQPSSIPSAVPSTTPSKIPTKYPSNMPSVVPTTTPSISPSVEPSSSDKAGFLDFITLRVRKSGGWQLRCPSKVWKLVGLGSLFWML